MKPTDSGRSLESSEDAYFYWLEGRSRLGVFETEEACGGAGWTSMIHGLASLRVASGQALASASRERVFRTGIMIKKTLE